MALQPKARERQQETEMQEFSFVFLLRAHWQSPHMLGFSLPQTSAWSLHSVLLQ